MPAQTPSGSRLTEANLPGGKSKCCANAIRDQPGVILELVSPADDVDRGRLGQRLARVEGLKMGDFVVALTQYLHSLEHDAGALHGGHHRPHLEAGLRCRHRRVDVCLAGLLDFADDAIGGRVDRLKGLPRGGVNVPAVYVQLLGRQCGGRVDEIIH